MANVVRPIILRQRSRVVGVRIVEIDAVTATKNVSTGAMPRKFILAPDLAERELAAVILRGARSPDSHQR